MKSKEKEISPRDKIINSLHLKISHFDHLIAKRQTIEDGIEKENLAKLPTFGKKIAGLPKGMNSADFINQVSNMTAFYTPKKFVRNWLFVSAYSSLEIFLKKFCEDLQASMRSKIKLRDLKDRGLPRARNFLAKVANLSSDKLKKKWKAIEDYKSLRDFIVHNEANTRECDEGIKKNIERIVNKKTNKHKLSINKYGDLFITVKYFNESMKNVGALLHELLNVFQKYPSKKSELNPFSILFK